MTKTAVTTDEQVHLDPLGDPERYSSPTLLREGRAVINVANYIPYFLCRDQQCPLAWRVGALSG